MGSSRCGCSRVSPPTLLVIHKVETSLSLLTQAHVLAFQKTARLWFEYVESSANWSDGLSRDLAEDSMCRSLGVKPKVGLIPSGWWSQTLLAVAGGLAVCGIELHWE